MSLRWANSDVSRARTVNIAHAEMKIDIKSYIMNVSKTVKGYPIGKKGNLFFTLLQCIKVRISPDKGMGLF